MRDLFALGRRKKGTTTTTTTTTTTERTKPVEEEEDDDEYREGWKQRHIELLIITLESQYT